MNRMSESTLESLRTKIKTPKASRIGTVRTPREEAEEKVHLHGGKPSLPAENLMACLIAAGVFMRLDAKRQISTSKSTILPGLMSIQDFTLPLKLPNSSKPATWEADVRQGRNPNGGEAVAICRPRFDAWSFSCTIDIDTNEIGENAIRELWDKVGRRIGLGDFRPARKGVFGKFVVEKWERQEERMEAAE
jgi:hypothetical protein